MKINVTIMAPNLDGGNIYTNAFHHIILKNISIYTCNDDTERAVELEDGMYSQESPPCRNHNI